MTAWKACSAKLRLDRHLVNRRIALDVHQLRHADGTCFADAPEIVPDEIYDHEVLGHVLLPLREASRQDKVFGGRFPPENPSEKEARAKREAAMS